MNCKYFGSCASCTLYDKNYDEQLNYKIQREKNRFSNLTTCDFDIIKSASKNFRNRAEFSIWWEKDEYNDKDILTYAMNDFNKEILKIDSCEIVNEDIINLMPKLLTDLEKSMILSFRLFAIEFLVSSTSDMLVTLIYHKKLDDEWINLAREIEQKLNIKIIGRSRKQKIVLSSDFIKESLNINNQEFKFAYEENGFTQPNTSVNIKMIEWVLNNTKDSKKDLCELYCGGGNFTIPLSKKFNKVLATEISKTSIKSALRNCALNNIENIDFIRMSSEEEDAFLPDQSLEQGSGYQMFPGGLVLQWGVYGGSIKGGQFATITLPKTLDYIYSVQVTGIGGSDNLSLCTILQLDNVTPSSFRVNGANGVTRAVDGFHWLVVGKGHRDI